MRVRAAAPDRPLRAPDHPAAVAPIQLIQAGQMTAVISQESNEAPIAPEAWIDGLAIAEP